MIRILGFQVQTLSVFSCFRFLSLLQVGGGFSPGKLRTMLLGVEKKRKEEEGLDSNFSLRSQASDVDDGGMFLSVFCLFYLSSWKNS